jgi:hypothetical protein
MGGYDFNWKPCDEKTANAMLSGSEAPGKVWQFDPQFLPAPIATGMRGVSEFYVSGALNPVALQKDFSIEGEFAGVRYENNEAIPYRWLYAVSGSGEERMVYFGGFFKKLEGRHVVSGSLDVGVMFSKPHPQFPKT